MVQWLGLPCHCRCRHCLYESGRRITTVPFEQAKAIATRFVEWRQEQGHPNFSVDLAIGYPERSPHVEECLVFNRQYGGTHGHVAMNGTPLMDRSMLRDFLLSLKDAGAVAVQCTFYGVREQHDRWAGRNGDFDYLILVSEVAVECGLPRQEAVFLSREGIDDLPALMQTLDRVPGSPERSVAPWDYRGRGKTLESERPTAADLERLSDDLRGLVSLHSRHGGYRSEAEWLEKIAGGDFPRKGRRYYILTLWEESIDHLASADSGAILQELRDTDERFHRAIPSLATLARLYGQQDGDRLYTVRDLEWKWVDLYLGAHPEIEPAGTFSDLATVVLWV